MTLSALIKKGGLAKSVTATLATLATQETDQPVTVAPVATVAVAVAAAPEPCVELSADEDATIRAWLAHIGETDPDIIAEVLAQCSTDAEASRYFLQRAEELPKAPIICERVCCQDCAFFHRIDHPNLGHCAENQPEAIAGLWDSDRRYCEHFLARPEQTNDGHPSPAKAKTQR